MLTIQFDKGRLSISGVVGPTKGGNCVGSCGQCIDEIAVGTPTKGWTGEMLSKFCETWKRWHLNDMRPYCEHQKELGWDTLAGKEVILYHYRLTSAACEKKRAAEKSALDALKNGDSFIPSKEQATFASLPYSITTHDKVVADTNENYEPARALYSGDTGSIEKKTLGWLTESKHPDGILSKACPICGYRYGSEWKTEEIPKEVIDWLFFLPKVKNIPAYYSGEKMQTSNLDCF